MCSSPMSQVVWRKGNMCMKCEHMFLRVLIAMATCICIYIYVYCMYIYNIFFFPYKKVQLYVYSTPFYSTRISRGVCLKWLSQTAMIGCVPIQVKPALFWGGGLMKKTQPAVLPAGDPYRSLWGLKTSWCSTQPPKRSCNPLLVICDRENGDHTGMTAHDCSSRSARTAQHSPLLKHQASSFWPPSICALQVIRML